MDDIRRILPDFPLKTLQNRYKSDIWNLIFGSEIVKKVCFKYEGPASFYIDPI